MIFAATQRLALIKPILPVIQKGTRILLSTQARAIVHQATTTGRSSKSNENNEFFNSIRLVGLASAAGALTAVSVAMSEADYKRQAKFVSPHVIQKLDNKSFKFDSSNKYFTLAADNNPPPRPDLPTIDLEKVSEHADEDSMWFTYRGAVYDMTFFLNGHPGGAPVS